VNCPPLPISLSFGLNWLVHATQYGIRAGGLEFEPWRAQQQQHSLFSQASWGRLEMKPKKKEEALI